MTEGRMRELPEMETPPELPEFPLQPLMEDAAIFASTLSTSPLRGHIAGRMEPMPDAGTPILILGFSADARSVIATGPTGQLFELSVDLVTCDWRFNEVRNEWVDINDIVLETQDGAGD